MTTSKANITQFVERVELYAFRASDDPALCAEFQMEHTKVLTDLGIPQTVLASTDWMRSPDVYVIVARHSTLGMVGGIRLHIDTGTMDLPMVETVEGMDPNIRNVLDTFRADGNGEVCGLWTANRYPGKGVAALLSQAVTSIANQVGIGRMVCFVAHYTRRYPARNGFIDMLEVGDKGYFDYPTPRIRTIAMINPDTILLQHASPEHRQLIYSLRMRPEQTRTEYNGGQTMEVRYALRISTGLIDLYAYQQIEEARLKYSA